MAKVIKAYLLMSSCSTGTISLVVFFEQCLKIWFLEILEVGIERDFKLLLMPKTFNLKTTLQFSR